MHVDVNGIIDVVANNRSLTSVQIRSRTRDSNIAHARQIVYDLFKRLHPEYSPGNMAKLFRRSQSGIRFALKKAEQDFKEKEYRDLINQLITEIKNKS